MSALLELTGYCSVSHFRFFANPWTAACQASLSFTNSWSLLQLIFIELVMQANHLVLCHPLLLLPSIFPSIRVFSNESVLCIRWPKYWLFSFSISPSNDYSGLISFRINWFDLLAVQGTLKTTVQSINSSVLSLLYGPTLIAQLVKNLPAMQEPRFNCWVRKLRWRRDRLPTSVFLGFPCGSAGKVSACSVGDLGSIPRLGRSPGERKEYPVHYSGLENSMDYIVYGVAKSQTQLSDFHSHLMHDYWKNHNFDYI